MFYIVLPLLFLVPGFAAVFMAQAIVDRFKLNEKVQCDFEHELSEEEILQYKNNKALLNVKMAGMLTALPGIILIIIIFR
ncbi:MAG: hypothetical protein ACOYWZ_01755 [Bacillota bacterium]